MRLIVPGWVVLGLSACGWGADLRVGVYGGKGQEGILRGLRGVEGIRAAPLENFSAFCLSECDVVVWPWGRLGTGDRGRLWRVLLKEYVRVGGGLVLTHDPVVVAGTHGKGRVVIAGNLLGHKGARKDGKVSGESEAPPIGGELALMLESLKWAGETFVQKPILPIELETALDAAEGRAIQAGRVKKEPVAVFSTIIPSNRLDTEVWAYDVEPGKSNKWGYWYGHGLVGPPYDMVCETKLLGRQTPLLAQVREGPGQRAIPPELRRGAQPDVSRGPGHQLGECTGRRLRRGGGLHRTR